MRWLVQCAWCGFGCFNTNPCAMHSKCLKEANRGRGEAD